MAAKVNRVLVIDDDEEDFLIIRDLLMDTGNSEYVLEWTSEVDAGRAALRARKHDAYLLDYRLGPADGMTMLREATLAGGPCPIIMLTGHGSDSVDQAALEAGASDFLVKGTITGEQLLRSLRYAIERDRQRLRPARAPQTCETPGQGRRHAQSTGTACRIALASAAADAASASGTAAAPTRFEQLKADSGHLHDPLAAELGNDSPNHLADK